MKRSLAPEQMDAADLPEAVYARVLADLDRVNRVTLAARPTLRFLDRAVTGPFRLLDVGYGDGGMLRRIAAWAKTWFDRPRPEIIPRLAQAGGMSFPSGHAVTAASIYLTLALLAARHYRRPAARATLFALAGLLIFIVAFSRVYLGVHYPTDVLSGALLGASWALLLGALFSRRRHHSS